MPASSVQGENGLEGLDLLDESIPVRIVWSGESARDGRDVVLETLGMLHEWEAAPVWKIGKEERGKPYFIDHGDTAFSVSDAAGFTAVCFDRNRIGLDLQEHRRRRQDTRERLLERCRSIAARAFHEEENIYMNGTAGTDEEVIRRFFRIWSAKEAYVKYTGDGIDDHFPHFSILPKTPAVFSRMNNKDHDQENGAATAENIPRFREMESASWNALGQWFFCADLLVEEMGLRFSVCVCAGEKKPVVLRFG
jgi:phosphopantetheinyl transferase